MSVTVCVDNRSVPHQSFHADAAYSSYFHNVAAFVGKFCALNTVYHWLSPLNNIAIAISPDKVRLILKPNWNIAQLTHLFEPTYTCLVSLQRQTWGSYFVDAITKFSSFLHGNKNSGLYVLDMISSDMCLFGDQLAMDIDDGLNKFYLACQQAQKENKHIKIFVTCVLVSENSTTDHYYSSPNMTKILRKLESLRDIVTFRTVKNTPMHFDEELRYLVSDMATPICCKLEFPSQSGTNCTLILELQASTGTARNAMHDGLSSAVLCGLIPRCGVDASYLEGKGLRVSIPVKHSLLPTERSQHHNELTYYSFAAWLGSNNLLALVRVPYTLYAGDEEAPSALQFWVLIPPPENSTSHQKGDNLSRTHMVMLKLVDRDDLLVPSTLQENCQNIGHQKVVSVVTDNTVETAFNTDGDYSSAKQDSAEQVYDLDQDIINDLQEYFQDSLGPSLGKARAYNPLERFSGTVNAMFEYQRRVQQQARNPTTTQHPTTIAAQQPSSSARTLHNQIEKATVVDAPAHTTTGTSSATSGRGTLTIATKRGTNISTSASSVSNTTKAKAASAGATTQKKRGVDPAFFPSGLVDLCPTETFPGDNTAGVSTAVVHTMPKRGRLPAIPKDSGGQSNHAGAPICNITAAAVGSSTEGVLGGSRAQTAHAGPSSAQRNINSLAAPAVPRKNVPAQTAVSAPPAPPRFFKRKFGATTALATPNWEDNEM